MKAILGILPLLALSASRQEDAWAEDWPEAARRARDEKKLVLVLVELYGGLTIPERLPAVFEDGPLGDLKTHRFVGLRWRRGMKAPFQDATVFGMGGSTFGAGILVATPDGAVVGQCPALASSVMDERLRSILRKHPEFPGRPPAAALDPLDRAEAHLKRGEIEEAEALLQAPSTLRGFRLRATLSIRTRRGDEALSALRGARTLADPALDADLRVDEATVLIGLGRPRDAAKLLAPILDIVPPPARVAEARFWLSHLLLRDNLPDGKAGFEETVRTAPGTRWARAAETILKGGMLEAVAATRLGWPDDRALDAAREVEPRPLPVSEAARGLEGVLAYLVRSQSPDGSWLTPHTVGSDAPAFTVATTAICGLALLPFRDRKGIGPSVDRALHYVLEAQATSALDRQGRAFGFGYAVWGRVFALRFLARCSREKIGEPPRLVGAMRSLVRELERDQSKGGGWTYYPGLDPAFVTGAALVALADAKDEGVAAGAETVKRGQASLRAARAVPGKFRYAPGGADPRAEAGPRGPLCEFALFRGGEGESGAVRAGLDHYVASRRDVQKERGKVLCHTGPDGTACYYLLFGSAFAAEALEVLPREERETYRKALLEDVLAARLDDGSFEDAPTIGRTYGAGMALLALARLVGQ